MGENPLGQRKDVNFILITVYAAIKTRKKTSSIILIRFFSAQVFRLLKFNFVSKVCFIWSTTNLKRRKRLEKEKKVNKFFNIGSTLIYWPFSFFSQGTITDLFSRFYSQNFLVCISFLENWKAPRRRHNVLLNMRKLELLCFFSVQSSERKCDVFTLKNPLQDFHSRLNTLLLFNFPFDSLNTFAQLLNTHLSIM